MALFFSRNRRKKPSEVIYDKGEILTTNPVLNDLLNRKKEEPANTEIKEIYSKLLRIESKIGKECRELDKSIDAGKSREKELKAECNNLRRTGDVKYIETRAELEKQRDKVQELISKRDELIDAEFLPGEYESMLNVVLSEYDQDREKRMSDALEHLTRALKLIDEQYDQGGAVNKVTMLMQDTLCSSNHREIIETCETDHKNFLSTEICMGEPAELVKCVHIIRNVINYLN